MSDFLQNAYVFLWAILAVYMCTLYKRIGPVAFITSGFFAFMTVWYGIRAFTSIDTLNGTLGLVFKIVVGVFLVAFIIVYVLSKRKQKKQNQENTPDDKT